VLIIQIDPVGSEALQRFLNHLSDDAASAAFEVGYESLSQFNREYRRFFGQPPMRDIKALRSPPNGDSENKPHFAWPQFYRAR